MRIEFTVSRDRAYARRLVAATSRRGRVVTALFGLALLLSGLAALTGDIGAMLGSSVPLGLGICWLLKPLIAPRQLANRLPATWFEPRTFLLTDDEVAWSSASARSALRWDAVARVRRHPVAFVVWQAGPLPGWDIPRAGLTPEQERELTAFLVERRLLRPADATPAPAERESTASTPRAGEPTGA